VSDYVIGDLQGCYVSLLRLLDKINYHEHTDRLWFVGDLVNRGPDSLKVLRFIRNLPLTPRITLGNHDVHLLQLIFGKKPKHYADDTLDEILHAKDSIELGNWLRTLPFLYHDLDLNVVMTHAGIAPFWTLEQAKTYALELHQALVSADYINILDEVHLTPPSHFTEDLTQIERLQLIYYYFARMRFCYASGEPAFGHKGAITQAPDDLYPWFEVPERQEIAANIVFGHWSALRGHCSHPRIHAVDTGCVWGGPLTALRLQDYRRFTANTPK
jgi:bis(5'-nucleosyl)-tetraphosphatase (symmetrical)